MDTELNMDIKKAVLAKIEGYDRIVIMRHQRPDGDALGSTHGLAHILRLSFPEKTVIVSNVDKSDHLAFMGTEETDPETVDYEGALGIVLDTAGLNRVANPYHEKLAEIVKIDHHIDVTPYGDVSWVEHERSSVCEMVAAFLYTFSDVLRCDKRGASLLYTGMVTDSGRFKYSETSGETLRLAGYLLDFGVDKQNIYANLYLEDLEYFKFQASVFDKMKITTSGVAYLYVDKAMQEYFNLTREQASNSVEFMNGIRGCLIWLAFIDNDDGTVRVRLRSRFIAIDKLANKYGGGGHANASGATLKDPADMYALIGDAEDMLRDYKAENEGWL